VVRPSPMLIRSPGTRGRRATAVGDAAFPFAVGDPAFAFAVGAVAVARAVGDGLDSVATDAPCTESKTTGIAANRMAIAGPDGVFCGSREILT
jgi:hypothetical protein